MFVVISCEIFYDDEKENESYFFEKVGKMEILRKDFEKGYGCYMCD